MKYQQLRNFYVRYIKKWNHIPLKRIVTFLRILQVFQKTEN